MAHVLRRLGEAALQFRKVGENTILPPIISRRRALEIRERWLKEGQEWPYEHIVPGPAKNDPPYNGGFQAGRQKDAAARRERQKTIEQNMARMPQMIEEYRASKKIKWSEVTFVDRILLSRSQIRDKYVRKQLQPGQAKK